jgi:molecular chaperone DnaK (HSP70)
MLRRIEEISTMPPEPRHIPPVFHIDVTASAAKNNAAEVNAGMEVTALLRVLLAKQDRQNQLLEELIQLTSAQQRQRQTELGQWKQANPELARACRWAAESLSRVQTQFLENLTEEVNDNAEELMDGEFLLNEFVDRFGPRLAHLNGVLQVLSQLSSVPNPTNTA